MTDIEAATHLGKNLDAAVTRYCNARSPTTAAELKRAISVIYLSGVQHAVSLCLQLDGSPGALQQLDRAVAMVATSMGYTKSSGREGEGKEKSRLILPPD